MSEFNFKGFFLVVFSLIFGHFVSGQAKESGPVIKDYGKVWEVENTDFKTDQTKTYKAVFDIMNSPEDSSQLNASIETAARFLNMHAQNGVPVEHLKVALVVHNKASKDVITSEAYTTKYGTDNPNEQLIKDLIGAGAQVIFCGQSSASRGFPKDELIEGVQLSLSAMTALIQLQDDNYRLIKF
ncbi:DsrE family protein [Maribacter aestuarii]|uniref:DsrE family protein n=1 Tax=Maribacter aestuarii TaxID=1130723 RepID=UPI00248B7617|nr:DsrE family protein [Maribacter aestuarii]